MPFGRLPNARPFFNVQFDSNLFGLLRSEEHTSELQSQSNLVCRLLLEKKTPQTNWRVACDRSRPNNCRASSSPICRPPLRIDSITSSTDKIFSKPKAMSKSSLTSPSHS